MRWLLIISLIACICISSASALTQVNIYLDDAGNARFLGVTDEHPSLPLGVSVEKGRVQGTTSALTQKNSTIWVFRYALSNSEMNVILPVGATVMRISGGEITTQQNRIEVYARNEVEVVYSLSEAPARSDALIIVLIIFAAAGAGYIVFRHSRNQAKPVVRKRLPNVKKPIVALEQVLNERENLILAKLRETGKVKGSYLRQLCALPKASFSRHVQELAKKGLVKISGDGRNKFIERA